MEPLAPPISVNLTPRQMAWLDGRRERAYLSRCAALRVAIDELIQLEQGSPSGAQKQPKANRRRAAKPRGEA
jgi:Arc/MetJ-type ribon-helix-helix transcriptional regulator